MEEANGAPKEGMSKISAYCQEAKRGDSNTKYTIAMKLLNGETGGSSTLVEYEKQQGFQWLLIAAMSGGAEVCPKAKYELGFCYEQGKGTQEDKREGLKWIEAAANQGYDVAERELGLRYLEGRNGVEKNLFLACKWLRRAAYRNNILAQFELGLYLTKGRNPKDITPAQFEESNKWLKKCAGQKCPAHPNQYAKKKDPKPCQICHDIVESNFYIGMRYHRGTGGVQQSSGQASKWLRAAASEGHKEAIDVLKKDYGGTKVLFK
eukprot:TRINITY_DN20323_c0_g1_i1.p1 TRINITY_DN20323_c0_g1~~TRINITY_DN20323_c0_g1_i1.p1  ORF type:complete len:264 (-),score=85.10 TRINITY_DN20323_c0_g1_i1:129-920(-)